MAGISVVYLSSSTNFSSNAEMTGVAPKSLDDLSELT